MNPQKMKALQFEAYDPPSVLSIQDLPVPNSNAGADAEVRFNLTEFYHNELHLIGVDTQKLSGPEIVSILNHLREGFERSLLRVSQPEINRFDDAVEVYTKVAEKKSRAKQVFVFSPIP